MKAKNDCKNFVSRIVTSGKAIYELKLRKVHKKYNSYKDSICKIVTVKNDLRSFKQYVLYKKNSID